MQGFREQTIPFLLDKSIKEEAEDARKTEWRDWGLWKLEDQDHSRRSVNTEKDKGRAEPGHRL